METKTIGVYANGNTENKGCEAISRAVYDLAGKVFGDEIPMALYTEEIETDRRAGGDFTKALREVKAVRQGSLLWYMLAAIRKFFGMPVSWAAFFDRRRIREICKASVLLCAGGDNYCYPSKNGPTWLYAINRAIDRAGIKRILYGASLEKSLMDDRMLADLHHFAALVVRESITYQTLLEKGFSKDKILLCADPAFALQTEPVSLPAYWKPGGTVGLNLSPMAVSHGKGQSVMENALHLVQWILQMTDYTVVLLPHVFWAHNDDRAVLRAIEEHFQNDRVRLLEGKPTAPQLKGYIAACELFIGARTHATIAAYSNCVPTLTLGYSVKAKGIARDLFGRWDNYVLPIQELEGDDNLRRGFDWLNDNKLAVKAHLQSIMPAYVASAREGMEMVRRIWTEE